MIGSRAGGRGNSVPSVWSRRRRVEASAKRSAWGQVGGGKRGWEKGYRGDRACHRRHEELRVTVGDGAG